MIIQKKKTSNDDKNEWKRRKMTNENKARVENDENTSDSDDKY